MSFRIHAAGTNGFRYTRDNCLDNNVFQAASIYSALQSGGPTRMGVASGVIDYAQPNASEADGARVVAGLTFLHLVTQAVDLIAADSNTEGGWIAVSCQTSRTLRSDLSGFARYDFHPNESPGSEFVQRVTPALVSTEMNNYGVLFEMSNALSGYQGRSNRSDTPMLLIQLTK